MEMNVEVCIARLASTVTRLLAVTLVSANGILVSPAISFLRGR